MVLMNTLIFRFNNFLLRSILLDFRFLTLVKVYGVTQ
jgi:hypothetical protein